LLVSVSELPNLPYNITLIQAPNIVNASAAGGSILVYKGLYRPENNFVKTTDELAAVLAHEIGHVTARHGTEELSKTRTIKTTGTLLSTVLSVAVGAKTGNSNLADLTGDLFNTAYKMGTFLWFPAYNREQETEADKISMIYLAKAGITPRAVLDIWKRAAQKSSGKEHALFASHPSDEARYKALEALLPEAMVIFNQANATRFKSLTGSPK
jgi:predicted Zn-dependent protease